MSDTPRDPAGPDVGAVTKASAARGKAIVRDAASSAASAAAKAASSAASAASDAAAAADHVDDIPDGPPASTEPEGSLFDVPAAFTEEADPFGDLGKPISREGAFYRGFVMAFGALAAIVLGLAISQLTAVLVLLLISVFLAVGLNPIVEFAIRRGVRRGWAVLVVALLILGLLAMVVTIIGSVLSDQVNRFTTEAPSLINDLRKHQSIARLDAKYHFLNSLDTKLRDPNFLTDSFGGAFNVGLSVFNAVANTVIVLILTLYFLANLPRLKRALYSLAPASRRERVGHLGDEILRRVGRFVIGTTMVALLAGSVTFLFLLTVGLREFALSLALLVALLDLVPLVGSITAAAIVTVVGFATSAPIGLACVIFYAIYLLLEGYVIYPRVMRSSVDVPEYVTIIAVLLGGALGGIVGALLALPVGAAVLLIGEDVWVRRQDIS